VALGKNKLVHFIVVVSSDDASVCCAMVALLLCFYCNIVGPVWQGSKRSSGSGSTRSPAKRCAARRLRG
jgi:hypothetical protein